MDISIVMTYYNRKQQLLNTLKSIKEVVEIIIVDDGSREDHDISFLSKDNIRVIKLKDKSWINPCIAFNTGFANASGDIIIIQNAECIHVGDIIGHAREYAVTNWYMNYSAYSINNSLTEQITNGNDVLSVIRPTKNGAVEMNGENGWYNHPLYRPHMLHFCSAITRNDLYDLGGFDERFADGLGFDDNEFLTRIHKKGMHISMIERPFVVHQYHEPHFVGNIVAGMELNSSRLQETIKRKSYNVKPFNKIYK